MPIFLDSETCGLHGVAVIFQYAKDDGDIIIHEIWRRPIKETLALIELFLEEGIVGFNLAFDFFHICKIYTTFMLVEDKDQYPEDIIDEIAILEKQARFGPCLKPKHCFDLMLYARKGPFQSLMSRDDVKIRKVPNEIAFDLCKKLEQLIDIDSIYFANKKNIYAPKWNTYESKNHITGKVNVDFKDVVLKFAPSGKLKTLATYMGIAREALLYDEAGVDSAYNPVEYGWAPFALAVSDSDHNWKTKDGGKAWPAVIDHHIGHWAYSERGRRYATDDVHYTREMYRQFGNPDLDDDDSVLATMVAAIRWSGFDIDIEGLKQCREEAIKIVKRAPKAPRQVRLYISAAMSETEQIVLGNSTGKTTLESISKWKNEDGTKHLAALRAEEVLTARKAQKEIELYDKLIHAGRFHASFVIIGTLSNRMSGSDKLNPQAINRSKFVRKNFTFCSGDYTLDGGDFDSFEIVITDAVYQDPVMHEDLKNKVPLHAVMGSFLYDKTMEEVIESKGSKTKDMYSDGKQGNFLLIYGGNENTFERKLAIPLEKGLAAFKAFFNKYVTFGKKRVEKMKAYCSMTQPGGIGTKVVWKDPVDYVVSLFGFKRFYTLENRVCKALFELAQNPPKDWKEIKIKVQRKDRFQTAGGATQSALFAAAFGLQAANMRSALNHEIQSTGATVTKQLERAIWDLQPVGIHEFVVKPFNCHDEVLTPVKKGWNEKVKIAVESCLSKARKVIPLLSMKWKQGMKNWSEK